MITLIIDLLYYFPFYIILVFIPMLITFAIERKIGIITVESIDYPKFYNSIVIIGLYFPIFEELLFRAAMLYFFGITGLIFGNIVWILLHPTWLLKSCIVEERWKKMVFFITSVIKYSFSAIFFSMPWLDGKGVVSIIYHCGHNLMSVTLDTLDEWESPFKRKRRWEIVKPKTPIEEHPFTKEGSLRFVKEKSPLGTRTPEPEGEEGEIWEGVFVKRKRGQT